MGSAEISLASDEALIPCNPILEREETVSFIAFITSWLRRSSRLLKKLLLDFKRVSL